MSTHFLSILTFSNLHFPIFLTRILSSTSLSQLILCSVALLLLGLAVTPSLHSLTQQINLSSPHRSDHHLNRPLTPCQLHASITKCNPHSFPTVILNTLITSQCMSSAGISPGRSICPTKCPNETRLPELRYCHTLNVGS